MHRDRDAPGRSCIRRFIAPDYQFGAKVRVYYKAPGKKKYKKIAASKLTRGDYGHSQRSFKIAKKHKLVAGGKLYFKVGKAQDAGAYTTSKQPLRFS